MKQSAALTQCPPRLPNGSSIKISPLSVSLTFYLAAVFSNKSLLFAPTQLGRATFFCENLDGLKMGIWLTGLVGIGRVISLNSKASVCSRPPYGNSIVIHLEDNERTYNMSISIKGAHLLWPGSGQGCARDGAFGQVSDPIIRAAEVRCTSSAVARISGSSFNVPPNGQPRSTALTESLMSPILKVFSNSKTIPRHLYKIRLPRFWQNLIYTRAIGMT